MRRHFVQEVYWKCFSGVNPERVDHTLLQMLVFRIILCPGYKPKVVSKCVSVDPSIRKGHKGR